MMEVLNHFNILSSAINSVYVLYDTYLLYFTSAKDAKRSISPDHSTVTS